MSDADHTRGARPEQGQEAVVAQLYASLEATADAFMLLDSEWRFTFVNAEAERILLRGRADLLGRKIWDVYPDGRGSIAEQEYERLMRGEVEASRFEFLYADTGLRLEVRAFRSQDGLAVFMRDITAEHAMQEQMRLLQATVAQLRDAVIIMRAAGPAGGPLVFVNAAFEHLTGCSGEAAPNAPLVERVRVLLEKCSYFEGEIETEARGEPLWVEVNASPVIDEGSGEASHIVVVARDITERKRAEQRLHESNERFRIVTQTTVDVIWDWNLADGTILWGDGMRTRFGYDYDGRVQFGLSWVRHIHPDDVLRVTTGIQAVIDGAADTWNDEYRFVRANGAIALVMDRGTVIRDQNGRAVRMIGSMLDITAHRELEEQLRQSQRLDAVGKLTGGVAHDFNNLLTVILSNAETLEARLARDAPLQQLAQMTRLAAERGAELTGRLLAFSRRQALDPKSTDVNALVRGMDALLRRAVGEEIDLQISTAPNLWSALIDALQLESAVLNLCINARDAMPNGGALSIETSNETIDAETDMGGGEFVAITVTDNGCGMDEATLARVFEPFFTTKDVGKGSGLGLSMVYGFITQSKGRVTIETAPGQGARVKLFLPRATAEAERENKAPLSLSQAGGGRILLVEDDDLVRAQLANDLASLGYEVVSASCGAEALATLGDDQAFDLLFTDVVMAGGMNGRELADHAHAIAPRLPVLFASGHAEKVLLREGRLTPGVRLLAKPYRRRDLAARVREAIARRN